MQNQLWPILFAVVGVMVERKRWVLHGSPVKFLDIIRKIWVRIILCGLLDMHSGTICPYAIHITTTSHFDLQSKSRKVWDAFLLAYAYVYVRVVHLRSNQYTIMEGSKKCLSSVLGGFTHEVGLL